MVHGKQPTEVKDINMYSSSGQMTLRLMVATTVIEVGVDVPNASVMVIESAGEVWIVATASVKGTGWTRGREKFLHFINWSEGRERCKGASQHNGSHQ